MKIENSRMFQKFTAIAITNFKFADQLNTLIYSLPLQKDHFQDVHCGHMRKDETNQNFDKFQCFMRFKHDNYKTINY